MSFINSLLVKNKQKSIPFTIYQNAYLTSAQDKAAQEQYAAISMTGYYEFGFKNGVDIAYEPLENSQFSSDSIQNKPYDLFVIGVVSQVIKNRSYTADDILRDQAEVESAITRELQSTGLLLIAPNSPLFRTYANLHLLGIAYDFTPNKSNLVCYMTFREIRQTNTQYGGLNQNQLANPTNASLIDNGNITAIPPVNIDTSSLIAVK